MKRDSEKVAHTCYTHSSILHDKMKTVRQIFRPFIFHKCLHAHAVLQETCSVLLHLHTQLSTIYRSTQALVKTNQIV